MLAICPPNESGMSCQRTCPGVRRTKPGSPAEYASLAMPNTAANITGSAATGRKLLFMGCSLRLSEQARHRGDRVLGFGAVGNDVGIVEAIVVIGTDDLEHEAVAPRDERNTVIDQPVMDVGLRDRPRQLAAHRHERIVAEQR